MAFRQSSLFVSTERAEAMSKPIKDIGTFRSRHPDDGSMIEFAPLLDEHHHLCILTFEERRELVREVWERAVESRWWGETKYYFDETVEQFIKEQGL